GKSANRNSLTVVSCPSEPKSRQRGESDINSQTFVRVFTLALDYWAAAHALGRDDSLLEAPHTRGRGPSMLSSGACSFPCFPLDPLGRPWRRGDETWPSRADRWPRRRGRGGPARSKARAS